MVTQVKIEIPKDQLADFCKRWKISEFAFFGSVLGDDFGPNSDIDVLITFAPGAKWGLLTFVQINKELETILGRKVDLVSRRGLETSRNYLRRNAILKSAQVLHVA